MDENELMVEDLKEYSLHIDWCRSRGKYMDEKCTCPCPCNMNTAIECTKDYPGHVQD